MPGKITSHRRAKVVGRRARQLTLAACLAGGLLLSLTAAAGAATFSNPAPITIPSSGTASPYPSAIAVSGLAGTTTNVKVTLNGFGHAYPGDVAVVLVPPSGQGSNILLMDGAGSRTPPTSNVNITFDDAAASFLPAAGALTTGSFKPTETGANGSLPSFPPTGPGTSFCNPGPALTGSPCTNPAGGAALAGALNGFAPNGTWNLYVIDRFAGDAGQIATGWTLDITAGGGPQRTLAVAKAGTGSGTVTSAPAGINCGPDCTQAYPDATSVVLTGAPAANSQNPTFTGCDSTTATTCTVSINAARNVTATFDLNPPQALTVTKNGTGAAAGTVTSAPAGIACGATCTAMYPGGTTVVLTASAPLGTAVQAFTAANGCDTFTATTCTVTLPPAAAKNVTATFTTVPIRTLTVAKAGAGTGDVGATGISCGADCTEAYNDGTSVVLSTTPAAAGSRFTGWTGCDAASGTTCTMSMTADKTVTANFAQGPAPIVNPPATGGTTSPGSSPSPAPSLLPDTLAPGATGVGLTRRVFTVAGEATVKTGFASARRSKPGTTFNYTLSERATVKIAIVQRSSGRRRGKSCVAPTRALRKAARCTRIIAKGTLTRLSDQGANSVYFSGRIGSKALSPGSYEATLTATDAASNTSRGQTMSFRIAGR